MASDDAYASFLDKANQPTIGGPTTQSTKPLGTKSTNTAVPSALQSIQEYYTSDADEPFEPVSLTYSGSSISASELKTLLGHGEEVVSLGEGEFEGYEAVVEAVRAAGSGDVEVFRVGLGGTRSEVWVVSVDEGEGRVVGLKALAVES